MNLAALLSDPETLIELDLHDLDRAAQNFEREAEKHPHILASYREDLATFGARLTAIAAVLP